jgi:hypothetical protein
MGVMMKNIGSIISQGIKESKWIDIEYRNKQGDITYYWIAVTGLDVSNKKLNVMIFNHDKSNDTLDATIFFDSIKSASILEGTFYEVPKSLDLLIE